MDFEIIDDEIKIYSIDEFNPEHIFECGQVFAYKKIDEENYVFYPKDKVYLICKKDIFYYIQQIGGEIDLEETIDLFNLRTNYNQIKDNIRKLIKKEDFKLNREVIREALLFGSGIRILKQNVFETIISFVFSQNNNIKRITNSLDKLREELGEEIKINLSRIKNGRILNFLKEQKFYSFPKLSSLSRVSESFLKSIGAGYRAKYLVDLTKQLNERNEKILRLAMLAQNAGLPRHFVSCDDGAIIGGHIIECDEVTRNGGKEKNLDELTLLRLFQNDDAFGIVYHGIGFDEVVQDNKDNIVNCLETNEIRNDLIKLKGIGRKVADCILLFGFGRKNVFPVDIWISQIYYDLAGYKNNKISATKISDILEREFEDMSGYIQQYLFYYKRSIKMKIK